jgi:hypothetical protein
LRPLLGDDAELLERGVAYPFDVHAGVEALAQELDVSVVE